MDSLKRSIALTNAATLFARIQVARLRVLKCPEAPAKTGLGR